ncbi:MAG: branched-chain amino acid ABC transporter ATP-binding protein/permease [Acidimicrobiales bacterium]|nr:branched-chain amino acid ABC transporter ATP-binding protein/permease [Acidimicrobiales bacterium]
MTAVAVVAASVYPFIVDSVWTYVALLAIVGSVIGLSFIVLIGWSGLVSFAQATLMGIGAYTAFHFDRAGWPFPIAILGSGLVVAAAAAIMGIPGLRLRGLSLGILTLAFAGVGDGAVFANRWFTGGVQAGAVLKPASLFGIDLVTNRSFYYASWAVLLLLLIALRNIQRRSSGRTFLAVKSSEAGAIATGLNPSGVKIEAFVLSGFLAGVAGALFAYSLRSLAAYSFAVPVSLNLAVVSVVGGVNNLIGALLAGFVYAFAPALVTDWGISGDWVWIGTGASLILLVIVNPTGLGGLAARWLNLPDRPEPIGPVRSARSAPPRARLLEHTRSDLSGRGLLLSVDALSQSFGGVSALRDVSLEVQRGSITTLIGPNGAGKSTLFRVVTGQIKPDHGRVAFAGNDITTVASHKRAQRALSWTYQSNQLFGELTVAENLMVALHRHRPWDILTDAVGLPASTRRERSLRQEADELLELSQLGAFRDRRVSDLPFGAQRRVDVTRAVALRPSLLLLDEPATGMNPEETADFGEYLRRLHDDRDVTLLFIEHDMELVMSLSDYVYVLDFGQLIAEGTAAQVRANPRVIDVYLGKG